MRKNFIEGDKT